MSDFMKFIAENDSHDLVNERINTIATATCFIELKASSTSLKKLSTSFSADSCGSRLSHCIAAYHSDFGGILPIFKQYSAIPIGMTVLRQNLKNYVVLSKILEYFKICENHAQGCKAVKKISASVASCQILSR